MTFNSYIDFKIRETLRTLQLMHGVIFGVSIILGGVIFKLVLDSGNTGSGDYENSLISLIIFSAFMVLLSIFLPNFVIKRIKRNKASEAILKSYRAAYTIKYILLVLAVFAGYVGLLYYSNFGFILTSCAVLIVFIAHKPHRKGISRVIKA